MIKKLIIISTHPIQYQVPLWQNIAKEHIATEVWYFTNFGVNESYDIEFNKSFSWDLPMLTGYQYRILCSSHNASPNKGFWGIRLKENIKKLLKDAGATHVYLNGWQVFAYWQFLWAAKSLNLTIIFKGESNDLRPEGYFKTLLKKIILKQFFKKINYFLYIGTANRRLYENTHFIETHKLLPGLYCVDNDRFKKSAKELIANKNQLRDQWKIPKNSFCILFSGKFIEKKRPADIIKAVDKLRENHKQNNIHLLFVGDGELYQEIKSQANIVYDQISNTVQLQANKPSLSFTGFLNQTEIAKAYTASDCLILPSDFGETWGLVVNEAMACGIPAIISNRCGSSQDLIIQNRPELIFPMGDIEALSEAISSLIDKPVDKKLIKEKISHFTYESSVNSISKIISTT